MWSIILARINKRMEQISNSTLEDITKRLVKALNPEQIILFGSYAWGTPTEESDVDIFVIVTESNIHPAKRARYAYKCLRGLDISKDILVRTRQEVEKYRYVKTSFESEILEKGKILYGQE